MAVFVKSPDIPLPIELLRDSGVLHGENSALVTLGSLAGIHKRMWEW